MSDPHFRPMSAADLSSETGLPPVAEPTLPELQAENTKLKATIKEHQDMFFVLLLGYITNGNRHIEEASSILESIALIGNKPITAKLAVFVLDLIKNIDEFKKEILKPNLHLLTPLVRKTLEDQMSKGKKFF